MPIYELDGKRPTLPRHDSYWVAPGAHVIGDVVLEEDVGIWFGSVLRGDNTTIRIGTGTNIQEHTMIHVDPGYPVSIGAGCTVGHRAIIHGCTIGNNTLIGMGAIILNGAKIGDNCLIGAGALITEGKEIPDNSLVVGAPGKVVRELDEKTREGLMKSASHYVRNFQRYQSKLTEIG
ncbi:gamma carbonic anhydrase family protein [Acuticoccus sp. M5D2P5]|uniref:gamma carbonic anhydrase family protein n=1 Tax=Acuticoccus kalidii TaxID=2910977 RepID=UPI001F1DF9FA|nr:gamma carbonic anhydrase family protein [Acuticoccus kalidii]MCF3934513.1 gamma carbonic anhydrase family protein [Acuticoccus kalidii]